MTKEMITGLIRSVLTLAGTYLFGKNIFGNAIDESIWSEITGAIMVFGAFVWSLIEKKLTLEIFQSTLLRIVMVIGGLLVTSGKLSSSQLQAWTAILTAAIPILYSLLSKWKSGKIASGEIHLNKLSK